MKIRTLALLALACAYVFFAGCIFKRTEYTVYHYDDQMVVILSALAHAKEIGGTCMSVAPTGSMRPTIHDYDYVVISNPQKDPYSNVTEGNIVLYKANWMEEGSLPVIHRAAQKDKYGWIMTGDSPANRYENKSRMNDKNYLGRLVAIYRLKGSTTKYGDK